jgi:PAS domain S-box-containing protein
MKKDRKVQSKAGSAVSKPAHELPPVIYEEIPVGITESSIRGKYMDANEEFCRLVGYKKEQLLTLGIKDLIFEEDYPIVRMLYQQLTEGKIPSYTLEKRYVRKDGKLVWVEAKRSLVRNSEGKPLYTVGVVLDVTERKRNEEKHLEELETLVQQRTAALQGLIQVLRKEIAERSQAEYALKESRENLQELSRRLVEVQEEERRTIARDLHDRVGQNLSALNLDLSVIKEQFSQDRAEQIDARLADSMKLVAETTRLVRNLLNELRPAALDAYGLKAALEEYIYEFEPRYNIDVTLDIPNEPFPRLDPSLEITLLRIAQEALTNVARHAQADQATLSLRLENNIVNLTVRDNGIGRNASHGETPHISHGLKIMRERAQAFGGTVTIGPSEEKGTKVEVIVPTVNNP